MAYKECREREDANKYTYREVATTNNTALFVATYSADEGGFVPLMTCKEACRPSTFLKTVCCSVGQPELHVLNKSSARIACVVLFEKVTARSVLNP